MRTWRIFWGSGKYRLVNLGEVLKISDKIRMNRLKIPVPISAGLLLSYKCTAKCGHCMYNCSPAWKADWISESDLEKGLSQLAGKIQPSPYGPDNVGLSHGLHFSGGEPFLNFELLLKAVKIADELDIPSIFVETNCYWCNDDKNTREKLQLLKENGLKGILISVNPFYAEYIPFERSERCAEVAEDIFGQNMFIYQYEYYRIFKSLGIRDKISIGNFLKITKNAYFLGLVELFIMGRASESLKGVLPSYPAKTFFETPCQPPLIREWHNHFDNYGNFMPGFCGGISLGNWMELDELLDTGVDLDERPVLKYLVTDDMEGLFNFAADNDYKEQDDGYLSKCHLCADIRKHLNSKKDFIELQPKEFYL